MAKLRTWNDRLNWALESRHVKPAELARASGVSRASVNEWTSGKTKDPKLAPFFAACRKLTLRPEWLALGEDPAAPEYDDFPPRDRDLFDQLSRLPRPAYDLLRKLIDVLATNEPGKLTAKESKLLQHSFGIEPDKGNSSGPHA